MYQPGNRHAEAIKLFQGGLNIGLISQFLEIYVLQKKTKKQFQQLYLCK